MLRLFISFYLLIATSVGVYILSEPYIRTLLLQDMFEREWSNEHAGTFFLLDELYLNLGPESFASVMERYPSNINLPVALLPLDKLDIPEKAIPPLVAGEPYVADILDEVLYSRVAESSQAVRLGPSGISAPLDRARIIYQLSLFAVLALPIFFWVVNLQMKTRRLEAATAHFGEGDFSTRVSEEGKYKVGRLNRTFNLMAERVERLINGHKSLTNAVAHELRTPISRIRFQLDMLNEEGDESQRQEFVHGISDDITELGDLVDELLTYARFDREPAASTMHSHSLHNSIENVISHRHFDSKLAIDYAKEWFSDDSSLQYVNFNPKHFERALGNLITNAEKYALSTINIQVKRTGRSCSVIVDDNGPGIPIDRRESIFEPFQRLDDSRTRSTGGYGLGLAIVKQIAQWHNGSISVSDAPIGGARFVFSWPTSGKTA